jgi:hypothetical protein
MSARRADPQFVISKDGFGSPVFKEKSQSASLSLTLPQFVIVVRERKKLFPGLESEFDQLVDFVTSLWDKLSPPHLLRFFEAVCEKVHHGESQSFSTAEHNDLFLRYCIVSRVLGGAPGSLTSSGPAVSGSSHSQSCRQYGLGVCVHDGCIYSHVCTRCGVDGRGQVKCCNPQCVLPQSGGPSAKRHQGPVAGRGSGGRGNAAPAAGRGKGRA